MRCRNRSSVIRLLRMFMRMLWLRVSKKLFISPSTHHRIPCIFLTCCSAVWQLLFGRKPCEFSENMGSYIASRTSFITVWSNLSRKEGMPRGLSLPFDFFDILSAYWTWFIPWRFEVSYHCINELPARSVYRFSIRSGCHIPLFGGDTFVWHQPQFSVVQLLV